MDLDRNHSAPGSRRSIRPATVRLRGRSVLFSLLAFVLSAGCIHTTVKPPHSQLASYALSSFHVYVTAPFCSPNNQRYRQHHNMPDHDHDRIPSHPRKRPLEPNDEAENHEAVDSSLLTVSRS